MSEWQPIETAPKDKTMVALLFVSDAYLRYGIGWWMPFDGWQAWGDAYGFEPQPTHWYSLPPVPKEPK